MDKNPESSIKQELAESWLHAEEAMTLSAKAIGAYLLGKEDKDLQENVGRLVLSGTLAAISIFTGPIPSLIGFGLVITGFGRKGEGNNV